MAGGTERQALGVFRTCQNIGSRTHRTADEHRLAYRPQRFGHFSMPWAEAARRALAMHIELRRALFLNLACVLRHIVQRCDLRIGNSIGQDTAQQMGKALPIGERTINRNGENAGAGRGGSAGSAIDPGSTSHELHAPPDIRRSHSSDLLTFLDSLAPSFGRRPQHTADARPVGL